MNFWQPIILADPGQMRTAKGALHRAIQLVSAVGRGFLPKVKGDYYAAIFWLPEQEMLVGYPVQGKYELRAGLRFKDFSLHLLDQDHQITTSFELSNNTQRQAMVWMEEQLALCGLDVKKYTLELPYTIPDYPPVKGKPFIVDYPEALQEYSNYYHDTHYLLTEISKRFSETSHIETWPHHFDMAMSIILNNTGERETSTSIGTGFSPGDDKIDEPYFYINTWPYPPISELGDPPGLGEWNTEDWVGAILKSSSLLKDPIRQRDQVEKFFKAGIGRFHDLLQDT